MSKIIGKLSQVQLATPSGGGLTPESGSVEFLLCGYGAFNPRTNIGTSLGEVDEIIEVNPGDGSFSVGLIGNDVIQPPGTYYTYTVRNENGDILQCEAYVFVHAEDYDMDFAVPFDPNQPPPSIPPVLGNLLDVIPSGTNAPTFDGSQDSAWMLTLTLDVTGAVLSGIQPGNLYTFIIEQDATGGHAFVFPTGPAPYGTRNVTPVCMVPNSITIQTFVADELGVLWSIAPATWWKP